MDNFEVFVVIKCGHEGIEELVYATPNAEEAGNKVRALKVEILEAKERMEKILDEFGREEDEDYNTHYDRMLLKKEIEWEEFNKAKYEKPDAYCAQKWDGEKFACVCSELNCGPKEQWLM